MQVPIAATGQPAGRSRQFPLLRVPAAAAQPSIESITSQFKALSAATVPLSQEIILLEQSHANLVAWQTSANREYASILHWLLLRVFVIAIALALILGAGELWTHFTDE